MKTSSDRPPLAAAGLFLLGLGLLFLGRFVQFDDFSGGGSVAWIYPLAPLALLAADAALVVAIIDSRARRPLAVTAALTELFIVWQLVSNDGFRFIWADDEGELFQFQVVLVLAALWLLVTGRPAESPSRDRAPAGPLARGSVRAVAYLTAIVGAMFVAFFAGANLFDTIHCGPEVDGDCDVGVIWGLYGVAIALVVGVVAVTVIEGLLAHRRGVSRGSLPHSGAT